MSTALAPSRSRLTSVGLVLSVHALLIVGLSAGLIGPVATPPPAPPQVELLKQEPRPPEPLPLLPHAALPQAPDLPIVPTPPIWIEAPSPISLQPSDASRPQPFEPTAAAAPELRAASPAGGTGVQSAGLLCPTQTRPQLPALAQEGSAHLRVLATVQGGRVVALQTTTLRALPERRAQRALLAEVEQALRNGYACTQDGVFEQEFLFRVE